MGTAPQPSIDPPNPLPSPSERCAKLLQRTMSSHATMNSALELPKVSDVLRERVARGHLTGESGLLSLLSELKLPDSFDFSKDIPEMARKLAEQTAVDLELIISAATIVLSHSTADDVFTGACELSIEVDPKGWTSELNVKRNVPLGIVIEKGSEGVLAEELESFRTRLANKSLPSRAELLFRHVPVRQHKEIPSTDPAYFRMAVLKEADDLRNSIIHGSGLPRIDRARSQNVMMFLHEAAFVAIRSVIHAYAIPQVWDQLIKLKVPGNEGAATRA